MSLRRMLTRRQAREDTNAAPSNDGEETQQWPSPSFTVTHSYTSFHEDIESSPPPPPVPEKSTEQNLRRASPSRSLIDRYKLRAPAILAPQVSPARSTRSYSSTRASTCTESFYTSDDSPSRVGTEPNSPVVTPMNEVEYPVKVEGANIEVITSPYTEGISRTHSVEVLAKPAPVYSKAGWRDVSDQPREKRSKARRQQRADSGAGADDMLDTEGKEAPALHASQELSTAPESVSQDHERPLKLSVRKVDQTSRAPSPASQDRTQKSGSGEDAPTDTSQHSAPKTANLSRSTTSTRKKKRFAKPAAIHAANDSRSLANDASNIATATIPSPSLSPAPLEIKKVFESDAVITNLPRYDPTCLPAFQWLSSAGVSSRPEQPWEWCSRWTCCRCNAQTIVEQNACARLTCGHGRCGEQCKVVRNGHRRLHVE